MSWFIVADHWQQLLPVASATFSVILPVDFSSRFYENEVGITSLQYCNRDLVGLLNVGCQHRRQLVLMLCCVFATGVYTRSFCEF